MNKHSKLYSIIGYIWWIGWLIAFFARDKNDSLVRRHLNQALILDVISTILGALSRIDGIIGTICGILCIAVLVLYIMGIIRAIKMSEEPLPVIGSIELIH